MIDVECKVRVKTHEGIRKYLQNQKADFRGIDHQEDLYFQVNNGRLKLRKGEIEQALVFYSREDKADIRPSNFMLYKSQKPDQLEKVLTAALGLLVRVKKEREIYFIDNIKFNLDTVKELGLFLEIEAMTDNPSEIDQLKTVVSNYLKIFKIDESTILSKSYSDLILELREKRPD